MGYGWQAAWLTQSRARQASLCPSDIRAGYGQAGYLRPDT